MKPVKQKYQSNLEGNCSWITTKKLSEQSSTKLSGVSPMICAGAWTAGISRPMCSACCSTALSRRTLPPTSTSKNATRDIPNFNTPRSTILVPNSVEPKLWQKRVSTSCPHTCSTTCASRPDLTPTSMRPSAEYLPASKVPLKVRTEKDTSRVFTMT